MTTPPPVRRNSFAKAVLLTVITVIPIFVLALSTGKDPERAGYIAGFYSAAPILGGIVVGIWAIIAKSRWNWFDYIWRFVVCTVVVFALALFGNAGKAGITKITEAEKQHLTVVGREARHTDFGFVVPLPNPQFQTDEELQQRMNHEFEQRGVAAGTYAWVLAEADRTQVLMMIVTKGVGNNEAALRGMGRGIRNGAGPASTNVVEDTVEWTSNAHEFRFATTTQGVYFRARCLSSMETQRASYILCVQTVSASPTGLDETRAGARVDTWQ